MENLSSEYLDKIFLFFLEMDNEKVKTNVHSAVRALMCQYVVSGNGIKL